ncbi:hypothetical protein [Kineococcus sp. NPDC059986]|uniref:hypothetical protein n=1 Tax=Kineococcus sp. NPDC059986 TaxID=3155538 RepID=UPI00344C23EB
MAHLGLRHLLRSSSGVEVRTNDLLFHLLHSIPGIRAPFMEHLSALTGVDVRRCVVQRENIHVDDEGRRSSRDFSMHDATGLRCIIETKVDSPLTSADQASRYLGQLPPGGSLLLVTRRVLLDDLIVQTQQQLDCTFTRDGGAFQGVVDGRRVVVTSWHRLLGASGAGWVHPELLSLSAALEDDVDFTPFDGTVDDAAVGYTVHHVVHVARRVCDGLSQRLAEEGIPVTHVGKPKSDVKWHYVEVVVGDHWLWVGYDAEYWGADPATVPGGDHLTGQAPSPLWIGRFNHRSPRGYEAISAANRERLDRIGATTPLRLPKGRSTDAVVNDCLEQACTHLRRVAEALAVDPAVRGTHAPQDTAAPTGTDEQ